MEQMDKRAVKQLMKEYNVNLESWCRKHGFGYPMVYQMLCRSSELRYTAKQMEVINKLREENFYVAQRTERD